MLESIDAESDHTPEFNNAIIVVKCMLGGLLHGRDRHAQIDN